MLEDLNALLEASKEIASTSFEEIPDGTYEGVIENGEFTESKKNNLMFKWTLKIEDEPFKNRKEWKYQVLNDAKGMKRLTTDLTKFGVDCSSIDSINDDIDNIIDVPVVIVITHDKSGEYRNISISPIK